MDFTVAKASFLKGLYLAQGIADKKSPQAILANVLLKSDGKNKMLIAATDLTVSVVSETEAKVTREGGLTLNARALYDIVRGLPTEEVSLTRQENNWAQVKSGKSEFKIVGLGDKDFPKLPDHRELSFVPFDAALLRDLITKTLFSISTDETRYHLSGALFEADGKLARLVSTDGHRLCIAEAPSTFQLEAPALVPRKGLVELRKAIEGVEGDVELAFHQGHAYFRVGSVVLAVKLIDAKFPPYDQVLPKSAEKVVTVARTALADALKRVSLLAVEKTNGVRLELKKGTLRITADNPELGEAREEVDVDYGGAPLAIGFNARYLLEVLAEMPGEQVVVELNGELDPAVIRPQEGRHYLGVIMPMRI